jgi:hypothetical protein
MWIFVTGPGGSRMDRAIRELGAFVTGPEHIFVEKKDPRSSRSRTFCSPMAGDEVAAVIILIART